MAPPPIGAVTAPRAGFAPRHHGPRTDWGRNRAARGFRPTSSRGPPLHRSRLHRFARERNVFNIRALAFDERGRLWLRVERGPLEATAFDVFDGAGRYLGAVRVAARVRDFALGAGMLAAVTLDELDVSRIAVWRVQ
jgi:hypothetical protein